MPGFDYKFLEKPKRRLLCPLCTKAMREPVRVSTCGHRFCDTCLQEFLRSAGAKRVPGQSRGKDRWGSGALFAPGPVGREGAQRRLPLRVVRSPSPSAPRRRQSARSLPGWLFSPTPKPGLRGAPLFPVLLRSASLAPCVFVSGSLSKAGFRSRAGAANVDRLRARAECFSVAARIRGAWFLLGKQEFY